MKRISILVLALISLAYSAHAASPDSPKKKVVHHIQFLWGNYAGWKSYVQENAMNMTLRYAPMYSYSAGFEYKAELTPVVGLRTGINYFTLGFMGDGVLGGEIAPELTFTSSLHIPVDILVHKNLRKGRLVFSAGPDIYMPINTFGKYNISDNRLPSIHDHSSPENFLKNGSLGFTTGLGYERKFSNNLSVEFMPDFRVLNIIPFDIIQNGSPSFQMALGLSTYITFY